MMEPGLTVAQLRAELERQVGDSSSKPEWPVVLQVTTAEGDYTKAYLTSVSFVRDNLPDTDGGDDIHNAGFVAVLQADMDQTL